MDFDFIVIGAGISGAAAAHALAALGRVLLLEAEAQPGYHSSGRSAALFTPNYGNATVRALIAAARPFFLAPPAGFAEPLLARRGEHRPSAIVNAAGAWADQVAALAGLPGIGLVPRRRTIIVVDTPAGLHPQDWPAVDQIETGAYLKPETGRLLASPGDETPAEPGDAQPEEIDVALAADWLERATTLPIRHIRRRWAGLRSFVADEVPVVAPDPVAEGFFWLAGQGGYGVMLAPI